MQWLTNVALANAVAATLLAVVAWLISRCVRRPALVHVLWVLVLVKLITPPLFQPSVALPTFLTTDAITVSRPVDPVPPRPAVSDKPRWAAAPSWAMAPGDAHQTSGRKQRATTLDEPAQANATAADRFVMARPSSGASAAALWWRDVVCGHDWYQHVVTHWSPWGIYLWVSGTIVWFVGQTVMTVRFRLFLARAITADTRCDSETSRMARRMGLSRWPKAQFVEGTGSPMLWGLGPRAMILLPPKLFNEMSCDRRATLIGHELAHFKRGDQWVRLLELITTGLFWWHPVVWWARREIEVAEEQCCDAWVVERCTGKPRTYAEALLETVDFVSTADGGPSAVGASGIGHAPLLRKRLKAIMTGGPPKSLSKRGRCVVVVLALIGLPTSPGIFSPAEREASAKLALTADLPARDPLSTDQSSLVTERRSHLWGSHENENILAAPPTQEPAIWATAISNDGRYVIEAHLGYRSLLRDAVTGRTIDFSLDQFTCVAFSPDGSLFVSGSKHGKICLWDSATGRIVREVGTTDSQVHSVAFSPTGQRIAAACDSGLLIGFEVADENSELTVLAQRDVPLRCIRFSPDRRWIALAANSWLSSETSHIEVWDNQSRSKLVEFDVPISVGALEFADDSLLVADWSGQVLCHSASDGQFLGQTAVSKDLVSSASFSTDTRAFEATRELLGRSEERANGNPL